MARSDRLMRLMNHLRHLPAPVSAARLAQETGVSPRQIYRDIATLRVGGAIIDGESGVGYCLTEDSALPPQRFSRTEIEALRLAVDALPLIGDPALVRAAHDALARMVATLPDHQAQQAMHAVSRILPRMTPPDRAPQRAPPKIDIAAIRAACWDEMALHIAYTDLSDQPSTREIWPLGLYYSEHVLMLLAHCRLRMGFRTFHVNRIQHMTLGDNSFRPRRVSLIREYAEIQRTRSTISAKA